jgi:hypothetical protein
MSVDFDITAESLVSQNYRRLHAGDDYNYRFHVTRNSLPLSLIGAGVKIWFTVKEASLKNDSEAKLQLTSASSTQIEITDAANGDFTVKFAAASTADLEGEWQYDLQVKALIDGSLKVMTVAKGLIEFLPNLTRATS